MDDERLIAILRNAIDCWMLVEPEDRGDMLTAAQAIRDATLHEAARIVEGGSFLHDESPPAKFAKEAAAAIRRAIKP